VLERSIDVIRVGPVAVGGPRAVARLDAIARAWQLELAIAAETSLLVSRALAIHLAVTMVTAMPAGRRDDSQAVPWLRAADDTPKGQLPSAPGLGVVLDRDALVATGVERMVVT
jgi:L-alanine-DL-glutamate epimerase-like enolase superfamily enzyme